jgi:ABC-2 type transport system permease protein
VRKVLLIAARDYKAAVRTKSFIISLVIMPVLMAISGGAQYFIRRQSDTEDKHFALIDRTPGGKVAEFVQQAAEKRNKKDIVDPASGRRTRARFVIDAVPPVGKTPEEYNQQRLQLSQQVRDGKYWGFVEIGPDTDKFGILPRKPSQSSEPADPMGYLRYQTNHTTYEEFPLWVERTIVIGIMSRRAGLPPDALENQKMLTMRREGLSQYDPATGRIEDPPLIHQIARFVVPALLVALMFMVIMLASTPAMHAVVEEKMQRIAEVLLGSVSPFQLMMGKLLGVMGVSLTVAAVYLGGAYWAARHYELTQFLPLPLLFWFLVFQTLAVLMYGSLFLAIGSAATDIKETQTLVMPVILIACVPMMILGNAIEDPNNSLVVATSFFPPVTPMMMLARIGIPPGPVWWQPLVGVVMVLALTAACVYAAGRIFRVGILMQGKGARVAQLVQWVFRG